MIDPTTADATDASALPGPTLVELAARITAAFLEHQRIDSAEVPALIRLMHGALATLAAPEISKADRAEEPSASTPRAVSIRKSLADPDWIISMIDGKRYRGLKRHVGTHGFTPQDYRARFGLPANYPMVAPGYAAARSAVAKKIGLGRKKAIETPAEIAAVEPAPATAKPRGRPTKTAV